MVAVQNHTPVSRKRLAVAVEHLGHVLPHQLARTWVVHKWGMIDDPRPPVYHVRDFRKYVLRGLEPRLLLDLLPAFSGRHPLRFFNEHLGVHMRIPHLKRAHLRVLAHMLTIRFRHRKHGIAAAPAAHAEFTRREDNTRR